MKTLARILMLSSLSAMVMTGAVAQEIDTLGLEPLTVWMEIPTAPGNHPPRGRYWHGMVYDSVRGEVIMTGGSAWGAIVLSTWAWDGTVWSQRTASGPPLAMFGFAFDPDRGVAVLHGGFDGSSYSGTTWEFDGQTWRAVSPAGMGCPVTGCSPAMAYHPGRERMLLHGGSRELNYNVVYADTWEWDGATWQRDCRCRRPPPGEGRDGV